MQYNLRCKEEPTDPKDITSSVNSEFENIRSEKQKQRLWQRLVRKFIYRENDNFFKLEIKNGGGIKAGDFITITNEADASEYLEGEVVKSVTLVTLRVKVSEENLCR